MPSSMLISNAECCTQGNYQPVLQQDVRVEQGIVTAIGKLEPKPGEQVLDAAGAALLPGLHDHHVHLASYAAALGSVPCGPPVVCTEPDLITQLNKASSLQQPESTSAVTGQTSFGVHWHHSMSDTRDGDWLRGINYHESVAGDIDRRWLDRYAPKRPVRIQHRSGRLWILNSMALEVIKNSPLPFESQMKLSPKDGRLYDVDNLLREITKTDTLPIKEVSRNLASFGVTGINDMTPSNNLDTYKWFTELQSTRALLQKLRLSGTSELSAAGNTSCGKIQPGECKIHLHESDLPDYHELCQTISTSHDNQRAVAIHCVTETELVFALAAMQEAGFLPGDRIEHASVVPERLLTILQESGCCVVTQPNFILDRGDAYLSAIPKSEHGWLYRCQSLSGSVPFAFGTDLPFGNPDPWIAVKAATNRQTRAGKILGENEAMTPEAAVECFLGELEHPAEIRSIAIGVPADFCLLDSPWSIVRRSLSSAHVRATMVDGELVYQKPGF